MDGVNAIGQGLFQIMEHVVGWAWAGVLSGDLVQELLKVLQLNQEHHVLQKVGFNEGWQLWGPQELKTYCIR